MFSSLLCCSIAMCVAIFLHLCSFAVSHPNKIKNLPGQPHVEFHQFSGYVNVDNKNQKALFFYFVEAQNDAASKPLVLWLNGGSFFIFFIIHLYSYDFEVCVLLFLKDLVVLLLVLVHFQKMVLLGLKERVWLGTNSAGIQVSIFKTGPNQPIQLI